MPAPEDVVEAARWFRRAKDDLRFAERIVDDASVPPHYACWLSQQSAEKILKAALLYLRIDFPYSHDLDALRNLLPDEWSVRTASADLGALSKWAVESRYPSTDPDPTPSEATIAFRTAQMMFATMVRDIGELAPDLPTDDAVLG